LPSSSERPIPDDYRLLILVTFKDKPLIATDPKEADSGGMNKIVLLSDGMVLIREVQEEEAVKE
jgi:hypothetical protein